MGVNGAAKADLPSGIKDWCGWYQERCGYPMGRKQEYSSE